MSVHQFWFYRADHRFLDSIIPKKGRLRRVRSTVGIQPWRNQMIRFQDRKIYRHLLWALEKEDDYLQSNPMEMTLLQT